MKKLMIITVFTGCDSCPHAVHQAEGILCLALWKRVAKGTKTYPRWCPAQRYNPKLTVEEAVQQREEEIKVLKEKYKKDKAENLKKLQQEQEEKNKVA